MNPGYDDAMQHYLEGGFVRHIRRAISAIPAIATCLAVLVMAPTIMTTTTSTARAGAAPINLCDYSGPTFDEVNALLHDRVRPGDHVDRLRNMLSATPGFQAGEPRPGRFLNFKGEFIRGTLEFGDPPFNEKDVVVQTRAICDRGNGNIDLWLLPIHGDKNQKIIEFQPILLYYDKAFSKRKEALDASRYLDTGSNSRQAEQAVLSLWKDRKAGADEIIASLSDAGFVDITDSRYWNAISFGEGAKPNLQSGHRLKIYHSLFGVEGTSFSQESLFFRASLWFFESSYILYVVYDPETDEIISISADPPKPE